MDTDERHANEKQINWTDGEDVIVPPTVSTADARKKFTDVREVRPYLRFTSGNAR